MTTETAAQSAETARLAGEVAEPVDVAAYTLAHGGGTFAINRAVARASFLHPVEPSAGYAVAIAPNDLGRTILGPAVYEGAINWLAVKVAADYPNAAYVGTWVDGGTVYVDPVIIVNDRADALAVGRVFGQLAVYDFAAGESIDVE